MLAIHISKSNFIRPTINIVVDNCKKNVYLSKYVATLVSRKPDSLKHSCGRCWCLVIYGEVKDNPKSSCNNEGIIKWTHFLHYWPFVWEIHRLWVDSQHKAPTIQNFNYDSVVILDKLLNGIEVEHITCQNETISPWCLFAKFSLLNYGFALVDVF